MKRFKMMTGKFNFMTASPLIKVIKAVTRDPNDETITLVKGRMTLLPGSIIKCEPEVLKGFIDQWQSLDPVEIEQEHIPTVGLEMVPAKEEGMWDVINGDSKEKINDHPLNEDEADLLIKETADNLKDFDAPKNPPNNVKTPKAKKKVAKKKKVAGRK